MPLFFSCNSEKNILVLRKAEINFSLLSNRTLEIDTLGFEPSRNIYTVNIITNKAFGHFNMEYGIIKTNNQGNSIVYLIEKKSSTVLRVSKDYISFVNFTNSKWGWFNKSEGGFVDTLPKAKYILDSLHKIDSNNHYYIGESNGEFFFNLNGKHVKRLNYGNLVTKSKNLYFNNLDYKLYKLDGDSLKIISNNGNDLIKQKEGIYFVPSPGYAVICKFDKQEILNAVDSVSKLSSPPSTLNFKFVQ